LKDLNNVKREFVDVMKLNASAIVLKIKSAPVMSCEKFDRKYCRMFSGENWIFI